MCDFHSIVVRRDGAIAHEPGNSHSRAVLAAGWTENGISAEHGKPRFIELEWDGVGELPKWERLARFFSGDHTKAQQDAGEAHYRKLAAFLAGDESVREYFSRPEYIDVLVARLGGKVGTDGRGNISLYLGGLTSAEGLTLPQTVGGSLYLGKSVRRQIKSKGGLAK